MKKSLKVLLVFLLLLFSILPTPVSGASESSTFQAAEWPEVFTPYKKADGSGIYDPASDVHPIDVDITSGIDKGAGKSPSIYVASDGDNFFVRLRVKGDPYDRKGGFLSSVWLVQLAIGGEAKATIGLNGKSPSTDYVYVADTNGKNVKTVYQTTSAGNQVEGTRILAAENGQYFLDFQVPISAITGVASEITADTPVQLFFGTSKAANLSVINKEWMDNGGTSKEVNFSGLSNTSLNKQPLTVEIEGGVSKQYNTENNKVSGKSSIASGTISLKVGSNAAVPVTVSNHNWVYELPGTITGTNGAYPATATVSNNEETASASQDIVIDGNTDTLSINGGVNAVTSNKHPTISGTYIGTNGNNDRIKISIGDKVLTTNAERNTSNYTWSFTLVDDLPEVVDGKVYLVTAEWTKQSGKFGPITAKQNLTYKEGISVNPISISVSSVTNDALPIITGSSAGAKEVEVRIDGIIVAVVKPDSEGVWKTEALEKPLLTGEHIITAIAINDQGNTVIATKTHIVNNVIITIDNSPETVTNDNQPTIRGNTNAPAGSDVTVMIGNAGPFTGKVENGRWKIEVPSTETIEEGNHTVTATVPTVSASQILIIDTKTEVGIQQPADGSSSTETKPKLVGTAEKEATVEVEVVDAENKLVLIKNLSADALNGDWMYQVTEDLPDGQYTLTATASDPSGNEADKIQTFSITAVPLNIVNAGSATIEVANGTTLADAKANLGSTVLVTLNNNTTKTVSVSWAEETDSNFDGNTAGPYKFIGTLTNLPNGITNKENLSAIGTVTVQAAAAVTKSIDSAEKTLDVEYGTSLESAKTKLGDSIIANAGEGTVTVNVVWDEDSVTSYNSKVPGTYTLYGKFGNLPNGYDNPENIKPAANITVSKDSIASVMDVEKTVVYGTTEQNAKESLGNEVEVKLASGEKRLIPIVWSEVSTPAYNGENAGEYTYTGTFGQLPNDVDNENKIAAPIGIVTVLAEKTATIKNVDAVEKTVDYGTGQSAAVDKLDNSVSVILDDETVVQIPVVWNEVSTPAYNGKAPGSFTFTGTFELPKGVINPGNIQPEAVVNVSRARVESVANVEKTVAYGTILQTARETLGDTVSVQLVHGEERKIPVAWSDNSEPVYNGTIAATYDFTGTLQLPSDVETDESVALPIGKVIVSPILTESIKTADPVKVAVKKGTSLESAQTQLGTEVEVGLEEGTKKQVPIIWSNEASPAYNKDVVGEYVFNGSFGTLPAGIDNDNKVPAPAGTVRVMDDVADIISYSFAEQTKPAVINQEKRNITVEVKHGTDVSGLKAAFTLSDNAQNLLLEQAVQQSGETMGDFTQPVVFSVIAEDGTKKDWTITVTIAEQQQTEQPVLTTPSPLYAGSKEATGTAEPNAKIAIKRAGELIGTGKADASGNWTVSLGQATLLEGDELQITATAEGKLESTVETVEVLGLTFSLTSDPASLVADGVSTSNLKAVLKDSEGNAISGVKVAFSAEDGAGTLSVATAQTDEKGEAIVVLTSPKIVGLENVEKTITVQVADQEKGIFSETDLEIQFTPPVVVGQVLDGNGRPFVNAKVWIGIDGKEFTGLTDSKGNYSIKVPQDGKYIVNIQVDSEVDGVKIPVVLKQHADVQTEGRGEESKPDGTVSGKLLVKTEDSGVESAKSIFEGAELLVHVFNEDGSPAGVHAEIDAEGIYTLTDFEPEKTYNVVFNIAMNGERLAGKLSKIKMGIDGQLIVQNELIDPYGIIKDAKTGELLAGVNVKLYWADTELNKEKKRVPHTLVELPKLQNFEPNQNKNPQTSTGQLANTDVTGNYAWMVFAQSDYYIRAEKEGYVTYDSRNDKTTVSKLGDSWIENGIIHIGETIMRYDFAMTAQTKVTPSPTPTPTVPVEPVPVEPVPVEPVPVEPVPVEPAPITIPTITIDTPIEGQFIVDTIAPFTGTTDAKQKLVIYLDGKQIGTATGDKNGKWTFAYPNKLAEGNHTVYAVVVDSAGKPVESKKIHFEFAKTKQHIQYMHGFKDGEFKPELAVTRAQMAAMLSRNLTDNRVPVTSQNSYLDTQTSWAKNDIEYALSQGIMLGFSNKKFRPTDEVTRAQMATIAVRWIETQCAKNPKYASYCSTEKAVSSYKDVSADHWAAGEIKKISQTGLMTGFTNGSFKPEEKLTRAQATRVLNRLFQRGPLEGVAVPSFKDVPQTHWAYKDVEEAAKNHFYVIKDGKEMLQLKLPVSKTQ